LAAIATEIVTMCVSLQRVMNGRVEIVIVARRPRLGAMTAA